jgi:hypothetical protein
MEDIGLWEINEAFAGQILGVVRELGLDREKLNVNGGAIALGTPARRDGHAVHADPAQGDAPARRALRTRGRVHRRRTGHRRRAGERRGLKARFQPWPGGRARRRRRKSPLK